MFSKDGHGQTSGAAMMLGAMLKPLGLDPAVIEALSRGLLTDLKTIVAHEAENTRRLEFLMRYTPSLEGDTEHTTCWEAYVATRNAEAQGHDGRSIAGPSAGNGNGASDPARAGGS